MLACVAAVAAAIGVPTGAAAAPPTPATGSLYFAAETAQVVGGTVLVRVRCVGVEGSICSGELSLAAGGTTSEAPFTTTGGKRVVSIPLAGAAPGASVVATARTAQSSGTYATATEVLHLR